LPIIVGSQLKRESATEGVRPPAKDSDGDGARELAAYADATVSLE